MTRGMMDRLCNELDAIGLGFEEGETRYGDKLYGKNSDLSIIGFLYNRDETPITMEQLAEVLEIAKTKKTCFVIMSELAASNRGVLVCFLQQGLFDAVERDAPLVTDSLRRNFSYFQEEESVMKLDAALQRFPNLLEEFRKKAYNHACLMDTSNRLRRAVGEEGHILAYDKEIYEYMADVFELYQAETLCNAIHCLQLAR